MKARLCSTMLYSKTLCMLMISVLAVLFVWLCVVLSVMEDNKEHYRNLETLKRKVHCKELENLRQPRKLLLLPNDTVIDSLNETGLTDLFWRYINSIQVLHVCNNQTRLGSLHDGGKEICFDDTHRPGYSCLVYSFGSNFQFDFEVAAMNHFRCEIHTFDPRAIDIEGAEWRALPQMFESGVLKDVKQLCIEIHFGTTRRIHKIPFGNTKPNDQLKVLRALYEQGFLIFMHDHNLGSAIKVSRPYQDKKSLV